MIHLVRSTDNFRKVVFFVHVFPALKGIWNSMWEGSYMCPIETKKNGSGTLFGSVWYWYCN